MKSYEIMFIVAPNLPEEEIDKIITQMEGVVKATQGELVHVEKMGKRKLSYQISKFEEGYYVLFNIKGNGDGVKEFERRLKVTDAVLRYITVRMDESLKRAEKIKAARMRKVRRKTSRVQPETSAPAL